MKNYLDVKKSIYKDIFMTILFVLITIPIWLSVDTSALEIAKEYDNYSYLEYEFLNNPEYSLEPVSDDYAMHYYETKDILIYNYSNTVEAYSVLLKLDKDTNIDDLKINMNYQIDYLNNYFSYEDNNYRYFVLANDKIVASSQKYILSIWNAEDAQINDYANLDYEIMVA